MDALDIAIRLIGLFYALGGLAMARRLRMESLLDAALAALTLKAPPRVDVVRGRWMLAIVLTSFAGGVLLAALSRLALPAFLACATIQLIYFAYIAPVLLDPAEAPDPDGRRSALMAFAIHGAATLCVAAAAFTSRLAPPQEQAPVLAGALVIIAAFAAFQVRAFARPLPGQARSMGAPEAPSADEPLPERIRLQVRPPVLPFADDATGLVIPQKQAEHAFGQALVAEVLAWELRYLDTIPAGRRTAGFTDPAEAARHEAEGRALAARMSAALGGERVVHWPVGTIFPRSPDRLRTHPTRIKVMADYGCHPLWDLGDDYGDIDPEVLGLSAGLIADLKHWAEAFHAALNWDDPGAPAPDDGLMAKHEETGRRLAVRLARELRDQGREVMVYAMTQAVGVVEVRADDPL